MFEPTRRWFCTMALGSWRRRRNVSVEASRRERHLSTAIIDVRHKERWRTYVTDVTRQSGDFWHLGKKFLVEIFFERKSFVRHWKKWRNSGFGKNSETVKGCAGLRIWHKVLFKHLSSVRIYMLDHLQATAVSRFLCTCLEPGDMLDQSKAEIRKKSI